MVVVVIIMVLASLTLSGLAVARQRVRIARTKSTIRKLHEIVVPHYESYLRRRVPGMAVGSGSPATNAFDTFRMYCDQAASPRMFSGPRFPNGIWPAAVSGTAQVARLMAQSRLQILRTIQIFEMPDSWGDVAATTTSVLSGGFSPSYARTGPVLSYAAFRQSLATGATTVANANGSAECLHMIVSRGGFEADIMEQFRPDEIGDTDSDGAPEFIDAWNQPIQFIRWAPGVSITGAGTPFTAGFPRPSPVQVADADRYHDPLDPARVDASGVSGFALTPLIYSEGPDRVVDSLTVTGAAGWSANLVGTNTLLTVVTGNSNGQVRLATASGTAAVRDNIFNHDLSGR
jgi:hypothetical protein